MVQLAMQLDDGAWIPTKDGDDSVRSVFDRHYSRRNYRGRPVAAKFVGPGEYIVLRTAACDAIFVWRKFISMDKQDGVNCAVFRNEGPRLSSDLIREACEIAWRRWPGARLYTYVNSRKIRTTNPGYCFIMAGWRRCGTTKGGLIVLEIMAPKRRPHGNEKPPAVQAASEAAPLGVPDTG